jgi:hypothetical protein
MALHLACCTRRVHVTLLALPPWRFREWGQDRKALGTPVIVSALLPRAFAADVCAHAGPFPCSLP